MSEPRSFQVFGSHAATAALSAPERTRIVEQAIRLAQQRDRGVHEGLVFGFTLDGKEWQVVVDLLEGWAKVMGKDELDQTVRNAVQAN